MIFQFHALLEGSSPRVWRRFLISDTATVADLMDAIMTMFQMYGYHLFHLEDYGPGSTKRKFETQRQLEEGVSYLGFGYKSVVAEDYSLKKLILRKEQQFRFFYDYGDDWVIRLKLEEKLDDDSYEGQLPVAIKGKGAGIIEDCGGVWYLNDMMQKEKAFGVSDAEDSLLMFDKEAVNEAL